MSEQVKAKAKIVAVKTASPSRSYWMQFIDKVFDVAYINKDASGEPIYFLDMGKEGVRFWLHNEVEIIKEA
jgi:hypothetical protein